MRSYLAHRSARLALALAAATALTATLTATADATASSDRSGGVVPTCVTGDLNFQISSKTQAGGYLLVTAKAKPSVKCYLEGSVPVAFFGSRSSSHVRPLEHSVSTGITLSGSTAAYTGINPNSDPADQEIYFNQLFLGIDGDADNAVELKLPHSVGVDWPVATNWHADPADAVPYV